ncbi:hypothetical protein WJX82_007038 [Trebouxia sp. C0006]
MESTQAPSSAKKRKLPSFMAVKPVKLEQFEKSDDADSVPNCVSPARPKVYKQKPRQSKLPLKTLAGQRVPGYFGQVSSNKRSTPQHKSPSH